MDTSLTNRKNGILEVAKIISKSNLFERQLENNKPIKVQIKAKNDTTYLQSGTRHCVGIGP